MQTTTKEERPSQPPSKHHLETAILDNTTPNQVIVKDPDSLSAKIQLKDYELLMNDNLLNDLNLIENDFCRILGKKHTNLVYTIILNKDVPKKTVILTRNARNNLRILIGDKVKVYSAENIKTVKSVEFFPIEDTLEIFNNKEDIDFSEQIQDYFSRDLLPLSHKQIVRMTVGVNPVEFRVGEILGPEGEKINYGLVNNDSIFYTKDVVKRELVEKEANVIGYDDIGGCRRQMAQIRELIELPLRHPSLFKRLGVKPPRGILMYGPPGTGKTLIAQAIANETNAKLFTINGPEIMSKHQGESESNLRKIFEEASKEPSIIFIDEIDSLAPKRNDNTGEVEKRVVAQLLTLMDGIKKNANLVVLAATNRVNSLDAALRRYGRFDRELEIGIPDTLGRLEILHIHTKNMRLAEDVDLERVASETHGFVGSDVASLCAEAAMQQIREKMHLVDLDAEKIDSKVLNSLKISRQNFEYAVSVSDPSSLRETVVQNPNVSWDDVGGLEQVKTELRECVQFPVEYPEKYIKFGMNPSKGVLFYGPPGCGKTLMAKAVASSCNANFISIKGPELLSKWVGQSESNLREIFDKARAASPCVLFFDEIDSVGVSRSSGSGNNVSGNMLNQMLAEMDGMNAKKNVFVIGATNRPDQLDSALLRPGRLDQLIYIPLPDEESRYSILRATLRKSPISKDVNLREMAIKTEGFSGADLTEICQRACKFAIKESIQFDIQSSGDSSKNSDIKDVDELTVKHFEKAMVTARKSVTDVELQRYENFARAQKVTLRKDTSSGIDDLYD